MTNSCLVRWGGGGWGWGGESMKGGSIEKGGGINTLHELCFLKGEAVPTIFSFAPETARKRRESSIRRAEESTKKLCIEGTISSYEACSNHAYNEDIQRLELTLEKSIGTEPAITVDKGVGKHTTSDIEIH